MTGQSALAANHEQLLRLLVQEGVQFVVVGGVGLQLRGYTHGTLDLDIAVVVDDENNRRVGKALARIAGRPSEVPGALGTPFSTSLGRIELLQRTSGVGEYTQWLQNASVMQLTDGTTFHVGSANDLLRSKEAAGRQKDTDTLPVIRAQLLASGEISAHEIRGPVAPSPAAVQPDARWRHTLGERPSSDAQQRLWDHGAELLREHYQRWGIAPETPLESISPSSSDHAADLAALQRQVARFSS